MTLQHCIRYMTFFRVPVLVLTIPSMLYRLPYTEPGRRPVLNEILPDLNPLEILFDVKKLTTVAFVGVKSLLDILADFPYFIGTTSECLL